MNGEGIHGKICLPLQHGLEAMGAGEVIIFVSFRILVESADKICSAMGIRFD